MGEPIKLTRGKEEITLYGMHEAALYVSRGWQMADANLAASLPKVEPDATDAAKALAEENAIDLTAVIGTGKDGRITIGDVRALIEA